MTDYELLYSLTYFSKVSALSCVLPLRPFAEGYAKSLARLP